MKKLVILVLVALLVSVLFIGSKQNDGNGEEVWNEDSSVSENDEDACAQVRNSKDFWEWKEYLEKFPEGKCFDEADKFFCDNAKKENSRAVWEQYLKKFPKGKCAKEGQSIRNKFKKTGNLEWSDASELNCSLEYGCLLEYGSCLL